jgi:hypothetical protein
MSCAFPSLFPTPKTKPTITRCSERTHIFIGAGQIIEHKDYVGRPVYSQCWKKLGNLVLADNNKHVIVGIFRLKGVDSLWAVRPKIASGQGGWGQRGKLDLRVIRELATRPV